MRASAGLGKKDAVAARLDDTDAKGGMAEHLVPHTDLFHAKADRSAWRSHLQFFHQPPEGKYARPS
jgi:hypothetical protein